LTDEEIEELATKWVNEKWPTQQKYLMSVSKADLKAGFIAGFKAALRLCGKLE